MSTSDSPALRNPVELTIEQTINRHAKARGGIIGFCRNYPAYYRWRMTRHAIAGYVETILDMAGITCTEDMAHKDLRSSQIRRGKKGLQTLKNAFHNFMNLFEVEVMEDQFSIYSGARAQAEVANDILNVEAVVKAAFKTFIQKRLVAKTIRFHASLLRQSLQTFGSLEKTNKLKSSKIVQISAQLNLFEQQLIISEDNNFNL